MNAVNKNRLIVTDEVLEFNSDLSRLFDYRTPLNIIENLHKLIKEYDGRDIYFRVIDAEYDDGQEVRLYEHRPETDKEYMNRIAKEQKTIDQLEKQQQKQEEKDRREYERLKQKFGEK